MWNNVFEVLRSDGAEIQLKAQRLGSYLHNHSRFGTKVRTTVGENHELSVTKGSFLLERLSLSRYNHGTVRILRNLTSRGIAVRHRTGYLDIYPDYVL